jgi:hypothetical protein
MPRAPEPPKKKKKNSPLACSGSTLCRKFSNSVEDPSRIVDRVSTWVISIRDLLVVAFIGVFLIIRELKPITCDTHTAAQSKIIERCMSTAILLVKIQKTLVARRFSRAGV